MSAAAQRTVLAAASIVFLLMMSVAGSAGGAAKADRVPPTPPGNPNVTRATPSLVYLAWEPARDDVALAGYYVYGDTGRARVDSPAYVVSSLGCGESSGVSVAAFDKAGNRSARVSTTISTAACPDATPPSTPSGFRQAATTQAAVVLAWDASTDDTGVVGYGVYRNLVRIASSVEPTATLTGLTCGTSPEYRVDAVDAAGNRSLLASVFVTTAACDDAQSPSVPSGLAVTARTASSISVAWSPSNDNVGVAGYRVSLGGVPTTDVGQPSATLSGLTCGTSYAVGVDAYDAAGNRSAANALTATTDQCPPPPSSDTIPPSSPAGLGVSSITQTGMTLSWSPASDNVGVSGYDVYRNGAKVDGPISTSSGQIGLTCGTTYSFAVVARDAAGNSSQPAQLNAATAACSTPPPPADTTPPSQPSNLAIVSVTRTSASLTWSASSDNLGVAGYRPYVNGAAGGTTTQPSATISNLLCGTAYTFAVDAVDAAGNRSGKASVIGSTAPCADTQAPTTPMGVAATSRTPTSIALGWTTSTDNVGVSGYGLYRGGARTGTSSTTSAIFSGLTCNTNYSLAVDAYDAVGNRSSQAVVMVSTTACADTTPPSTPSSLAATSVTQASLTLTWNASNDNVGVTGYDVYRAGTKMATVTTMSSSQSGLACGTSYTFGVLARDAAGNISSQASIHASTAACSTPPPPPPPPPPPSTSGILTGAHWVESNEFATINQIGYGFAVVTVQPGDVATAKAKLDAAQAAGIKLIIGMYPEPYTYQNGAWSISQAGRTTLDYFESRQSEILALFVFNEPYWNGDPCGYRSAQQLRDLRTTIRSVWPAGKIYHDLGQPSGWAPGGEFYNSYPCIGQKYSDQTGVADYVGIWYYPFRSTGYRRSEGIAALTREASYVKNSMGAVPVFLGQGHSGADGLVWPSASQLQDWNCAMRGSLPSGSLISWYVWRQGMYADYLANHSELWSKTTASACS